MHEVSTKIGGHLAMADSISDMESAQLRRLNRDIGIVISRASQRKNGRSANTKLKSKNSKRS